MENIKQFSLPKEFATKWVAALRSGEYQQGNGGLLCDNKYCCLGVAGKVVGLPDAVMAGLYSEGSINRIILIYRMSYSTPVLIVWLKN